MRIIALTLLVGFALSIFNKTYGNNPQQKAEKSKTYPYLAYLPSDYEKSAKKDWPLIIYLHGSSCKGNNLERLKKYGPPFYLDRGMQVDAIVISPQCPSNRNWTTGNWFESFYKELLDKYNIDPSRVYLTGMSLGGFGTWDLASRYPEYFAAIMPLCGGGRPDMAETMKDVPTWVFHGDKDRLVNVNRSKQMVNAMQELGSRPKFSVLKGQGHDIHKVYSDQGIYDWLLSQHKEVKEAYEKLFSLDFWLPKTDSVMSASNENAAELVKKSSITEKLLNQNKKNPRSFIFKLFQPKPFEQSSIY
jgi:predicted peptidase